MSFDVSLSSPICSHCGRGGESSWEFNLTHNVNGIVDFCLVKAGAPVARSGDSCYRERSWGRLVGWTGEEAAPVLRAALAAMEDPANRQELLSMQPANGWGTLAGTREVLIHFIGACEGNPKALISAHG